MVTREKNIVIVERDDSMQPEEEGKERRGEVVWSSKSLDWTIDRDGRRNERKRGVTRVTVGHGNVGGEGIERPAGCWQILL